MSPGGIWIDHFARKTTEENIKSGEKRFRLFDHTVDHDDGGGQTILTPSIVVYDFCPKLVLDANYYLKTIVIGISNSNQEEHFS
jgi:hypothetical protein